MKYLRDQKSFVVSLVLLAGVAALSFAAALTLPRLAPIAFRESGQVRLQGILSRALIKADPGSPTGFRTYYFKPLKNLIHNAGETALRDCFIATSCTPVQAWKFHGIGTSAVAAAETDTGCTTELTTQYNPDNTRATGSQTNNGANIYRTVGTNTVDATAAVTEFCLQSAGTGAGTPGWTRITFATINLAASDSLQTTYDLTIE
jgi:hypothetical protein